MFDRKTYSHKSNAIVLDVQVHSTHEEMLEAMELIQPGARDALGAKVQGVCLGVGGYYCLLFNREGLYLEVIVHELTHFILQYAAALRDEGAPTDGPQYYAGTDIIEPPGEQVAIDIGVIGADILDWILTSYDVMQQPSPIPIERGLPAEENDDNSWITGGGEDVGEDVAQRLDDAALEALWRRSRN